MSPALPDRWDSPLRVRLRRRAAALRWSILPVSVSSALRSEVTGSVAFAADLTSIGDIPALVERIESRLGSVAILVNNAGVLSNAKSQATDESEWRRVLAINLDAAFFLARAVRRRR